MTSSSGGSSPYPRDRASEPVLSASEVAQAWCQVIAETGVMGLAFGDDRHLAVAAAGPARYSEVGAGTGRHRMGEAFGRHQPCMLDWLEMPAEVHAGAVR